MNEGGRLASDWVPVNENHAIAVMAVFVEFADPLPDRAVRTALRLLATAADEMGLKGVSRSNRVQIVFKPDGTSEPQPEVVGQTYTRRPDLADEGAETAGPLEQVSLDAERFVYRCWDYISWEWQLTRIKSLLRPCLETLDTFVTYQSIGMEYLDKFQSTAETPGANLDLLLRRDCELLASYIFELNNLFHCHTGAFVEADSESLKLQVVRIDAVDEDGSRWVNIGTRQERRAVADAESNPDPFLVFDQAHTDLKRLLARVITPEQAHRIYLEG